MTEPQPKTLAARSLLTESWPSLALISVAFLNALCYPLITVGLRFAPHLSFAALRALLAGLALAIMAAFLRRPMPRDRVTWLVLAIIGCSTTSLGYLGMFHAAEFVSPGLATIIGNSQPLVAAILARLLIRERLRPIQHAGLLLGFLGIVVISWPQLNGRGSAGFAEGLLSIALATGGVAFGNVLMKAVHGRVDSLIAMAAQSLFGAIPLAIAAMLLERPAAIVWTPAFVGSLLGLALLATAFASWLWFTTLARVPLSRANAFTFLTPFIGLAMGVTLFAEPVGFTSIAGLALAAFGVVLVERAALDGTAAQLEPGRQGTTRNSR